VDFAAAIMKGLRVEDDDVTVAIRRCQAGEMEGLSILIGRFQLPAQQLALLLTGDRAVADDLVQDSFLQAYRAIRQFRTGSPFAPWLYRIMTNASRNRRRSVRAHQEVSLNAMLEHGREVDLIAVAAEQHLPDPALAVEQDEVRRAMLAALAELSPLLREAIVLRYYFGYADAQIALIVGCQPATVRKRLQRGIAALERIIHERYAWLLSVTERSSLIAVTRQEDRPHGAT
jgi:RNA polymerase sigma-70 factor, ECF subfamily